MSTKRIICCAALAAILSIPSLASAAPVSLIIAGGDWSLGTGWGAACTNSNCDQGNTLLNVGWSIDAALAGTSLTFTGVGDSHTISFGTATFSEENGSIDAGELDNLSLTATLNFGLPNPGQHTSQATATATAGLLKDSGFPNVDLTASFAPIYLTLDSGSEIEVVLSGLSWNCQGNTHCTYLFPETNAINATFTMTGGGEGLFAAAAINAIPEPSSMLLTGVGILALAFGQRKHLRR